jgi:hypothetical protein
MTHSFLVVHRGSSLTVNKFSLATTSESVTLIYLFIANKVQMLIDWLSGHLPGFFFLNAL